MATQPPKPQRRTRHSSRPVNGDGHPASVLVKWFTHLAFWLYIKAGWAEGDCTSWLYV